MFRKTATTILRGRNLSAMFSKRMFSGQISGNIITTEEAKQMPKHYKHYSNDAIITMASAGDQDAREERLIREIMAVDNLPWEEAEKIMSKIAQSNRKSMGLVTLPYKLGIATAVGAGFASIPMIFDINTVMWFNEAFVTSDVPESKDLETPLEVGSWAWNWMEPPLGQISFFLLCMQYARAQMQNLGMKPFTDWYKSRRADRICKEYPKYNRRIVRDFSKGDDFSAEPYSNVYE